MDKIKDLIGGVIASLSTPEKSKRQQLVDSWRAIAGPKIAPHTKPSLSSEGKLFVWVDDSTLAFELNQRYKQTFLKRVQAVLGENEVTDICFRVGQLR